MAFNLASLKVNPAPATVVAAPPPTPAPAVAINRPPSQRPVVAPAEALSGLVKHVAEHPEVDGRNVQRAIRELQLQTSQGTFVVVSDPEQPIDVVTIEGSAEAVALLVATDEDGIDAVEDRAHAAALVEVVTPAPRARRGRPRKNPAPEEAPTDPKAPAPAPTASGCAPSVGDLAADVRALTYDVARLTDAVTILTRIVNKLVPGGVL